MRRFTPSNKLRALSHFGGMVLLAFAFWTAIRYGRSPWSGHLLDASLLALVVLVLPDAAAYGKPVLRRLREGLGNFGADDASSTYVSDSPVESPERLLRTLQNQLAAKSAYDEVIAEEFSDGPGLTVVHTTYHSMFVRASESNRLIVKGDTKRLGGLVDDVSDIASLSLSPGSVRSSVRSVPVRGALRTVLSLCLVLCLLTGTASVAAAAYPSDAYNPAEKTVLWGLDARSAADPTVSQSQTALAKSAFLVSALDEKSVEIRIVNGSESRLQHASGALEISRDARDQLRSVRDGPSASAYDARVNRTAASLREEERQAATAIAESVNETDDAWSAFANVESELRARANATV